MKISLVYPPQAELKEPLSYIPLGLAYIGSSLIENGFDDVSVDNLAWMRNDEDIKLDFADIFMISYMSVGRIGVNKVVNYIREKYPESKIILGGPHPSVDPITTYKDIKPDVVIIGEAEKFIVRYLKEYKESKKNDISEMNGIFYAGVIDDLDSLPFPARQLFDYNNVVSISGIHGCEKGVKSTTLITSRGCPFSCKFCCRGHHMYVNYRYRSAENVKDELIELREDYGIQHVRLVDDCFTLIKDKVRKICQYTNELDMSFICITRADTCNFELLKTLKDGGCTMINIGVESGSDRLLLEMDKRETIDQIKKCVINAKKVGLETKVLLQYGLPGETEDDIQKTMNFLKEVKPEHYTLSRFTPLPGSEWSQIESKSEKWFYNDSDEKRNKLINEIESILYG